MGGWPKGKPRPKGRPVSEETRAKIRASKLAHWSDPAYRDRMTATLVDARLCIPLSSKKSSGFTGCKHTAESRALMSARMKESRASEPVETRGDRLRGHVVSQETRAKIAAAHMGMKHTAETMAKIRATKQARPSRWSDARKKSMSERFRGRPAQYPKKRFYYRDIAFRSAWEVRAAVAMDKLSIRWEYENRRFDLQSQTYAPDFYLPDDGAYWEVKGYYGPKSQKTIGLFRELYPEIPLVLLTERGLRLLESAASTQAA